MNGVERRPSARVAGARAAAAWLLAALLASCGAPGTADRGGESAPGGPAASAAPAATAGAPGGVSLWSSEAAAPDRVDAGPDLPAELGVRFRAGVAGVVTGIRFYKADANVGLHVGSLWSSSGQRLASAAFAAETASGWQQLSFPTPVPIEAGRDYVASYHCPAGHYSVDRGYFAAEGRTSGPLVAPASGDGGGNGLVAYGPAGTFPGLDHAATNYWVDVVFAPGPAPALASLSVAPGSATVLVGQPLQLAAVATYTDGSTQPVTALAAWSSATPSVASVSPAGVATALRAGAGAVRASFGGLSASAALAVRGASLEITTARLPDAEVGVAYSAALAARGGAPPYEWSDASGLPDGLTLDAAAGVIHGTPTAPGSFPFGVQVSDSAGHATGRTLSIEALPALEAATLWPNGAAPLAAAERDEPVTLGVRFRADVAGLVGGVRFYKTPGNRGPHVGGLWTAGGTLLAEAPFGAETASGWQTVWFAEPVPVAAGATLVASYHTAAGSYAADPGVFTWSGRDVPPLHAPASTPWAPNGVHRYGAAHSFPDQGWRDASFWVDVLFTPELVELVSLTVAPASVDTTVGSQVQLTARAHYSSGAVTDVTHAAAWSSSAPDVAGVSGGLLSAFQAGGATVTAAFRGRTTDAAVTVRPGTPPPPEGPGGPILVLTHGANPFSRYLTEILKAEGLNEYRALDVATVTPEVLAGFDVAVVGEFPLTEAQAAMLGGWVNAGGSLVAMRPDAKLAPLLGLSGPHATLSEGSLRVDTSGPPGAGIVGEPIQFHGTADVYALAGARAVATLHAADAAPTAAPAVSLRAAGLGQAAAFTYDLARAVVLARQGNPAWAGQERDQAPPRRSDDLFFGGGAVPDWIDLARAAIPQADEQQRLLANLILELNAARRPLPRFWYFPSGHRAVVVMTGDDHAQGGTIGRMASQVEASPGGCSVDDWECVRSTSYVYSWTELAPEDVAAYQALGFEFALHVTTGCEDWDSPATLDRLYAEQLAEFAQNLAAADPPATVRTHCVVWSDYDTQPQVERAHGIRLDGNYYFWPGDWVRDRPGFMTGSGLAMRFATRRGELVDVYQLATQMTDESDQTYPFTIDALLDRALGPEGYYGAFNANMHTDAPGSPDADAIVASALARGVPIVSARQLLTWLDGRDASSFGAIQWTGSVLSFDVTAGAGARNLRAMIPASAGGAALERVTRGGADVPFSVEAVKGRWYAFFEATDGSYAATYR